MPLVSVIIPCYNGEKNIKRCLDSIIKNTYKNLEIIIVDDGSTDASEKIINNFLGYCDNIKIIKLEKNVGLFKARLIGLDIATGKYISFVDSDDFISVDWYRILVDKAEESDADIVVGEWCYSYPKENAEYLNLDPFRIKEFNLNGLECFEHFVKQGGTCFSYHVVWNKLYKRELWMVNSALFNKFSKEHEHFNMWEDLVFSIGLWYRAKKVVNVHNICYFYFQHKGGMTYALKKTKKYCRDILSSIKFLKEFLLDLDLSLYRDYFSLWLGYAFNNCKNLVDATFDIEKLFITEFESIGLEYDFSFYSLKTSLGKEFYKLEKLKEQITSSNFDIISFDIFDTLILRPFLEPSDLFYLLDDEFNKEQSSYINFHQIRISAEESCRKVNYINGKCEDITLDDIYNQIEFMTNFPHDRLEEIKKIEVRLEKDFCKVRKIGKELYSLALFANKRIILISDMYLPESVITDILFENGYLGYERLFLSSKEKLTKQTGNLYLFMLKTCYVYNKNLILHIGDNVISDIKIANKIGLETMHLPRPVDIFMNFYPSVYDGELWKYHYRKWHIEHLSEMIVTFPTYRWMLALISNKFFDNPFNSYNLNSDFNGNPYNIGYAAVGPFCMAVSKWIIRRSRDLGVKTVHFCARDGFLIKKSFDLLNNSDIKSNYIYLSRESILLADIDNPSDLYGLFDKIYPLLCSAKDLLEFLRPIIPNEREQMVKELLKCEYKNLQQYSFGFENTFKSYDEFYVCLKIFINKIIYFPLIADYKKKLKVYFSEKIKKGDYFFDVGYSGRVESALSNILGFPVGSFYINDDSYKAEKRRNMYGAKNECFFPYRLKMSGFIMELLISEYAPSTKGYEYKKGTIEVIEEEFEEKYSRGFIMSVLHEGALDFIKDMNLIYNDYLRYNQIPEYLFSTNFIFLLNFSRSFDREIFRTFTVDDGMRVDLKERNNNSTTDFWNAYQTAQTIIKEKESITDFLQSKVVHLINFLFPKGTKLRRMVKKFFLR